MSYRTYKVLKNGEFTSSGISFNKELLSYLDDIESFENIIH